MTVKLDPERAETEALFTVAGAGHAPFAGSRVLEVGCGDGRLTWRYASQAAAVYALDPDQEKIRKARAAMPPALAGRVTFAATGIESFAAPYPFDLLIFSWSL